MERELLDRQLAGTSHPGDDSRRRSISSWKFVAGRDGAMSIYHLATVFDGVQQITATTPGLTPLADRAKFKAANKFLARDFPELEKVRHAVAHVGEKMKSKAKFAEHAFSGDISELGIGTGRTAGLTFSNNFVDDRFTNTWEGKVLSYALNLETLKKLVAIRDEIWGAFAGGVQRSA